MASTPIISASLPLPRTNLASRQSAYAPAIRKTKKRLFVIEARRGRGVGVCPSIYCNTSKQWQRHLQVRAASKSTNTNTIEAEVDKPLGLALGQKSGGGVVITAIESGGNAAKAGLKVGDQVLYTSSFFGDELWPADKLGFTKTAIQAKPDSVYFVLSRGGDVDVKRLGKRPAPPRFGRKLTDAQKARASHICLDCGYIYTLSKPFDEQADSFICPQCSASKKRFARYDVISGKAIGGTLPPIGVVVGLVVGVGAVGALLFYGLQ